jgi:hypothetical protein
MAEIFVQGATGILLYVLGVFVLPAAIGIALRRWSALGIVFVLWVGLMLIAAMAGWLDGTGQDLTESEEVSTGVVMFLVGASAVVILLPAEAVTAGAILVGRSIRRVPDDGRASETHLR